MMESLYNIAGDGTILAVCMDKSQKITGDKWHVDLMVTHAVFICAE